MCSLLRGKCEKAPVQLLWIQTAAVSLRDVIAWCRMWKGGGENLYITVLGRGLKACMSPQRKEAASRW